MFNFVRISLARQFLLASFFILLIGMLIIGLWVGQQIERGVVQRTAALTGLYMDSLVGHHLPPLAPTAEMDPEEWEPLDMIFSSTPLGRQITSFKLWGPDGRILYSTDRSLIGRTFPVETGVARALAGDIQTEITTRSGGPPDTGEQGQAPKVIETFAPVHTNGGSQIIAVAEFRQTTTELDREVSAAQQKSWVVVGAATLAMYLLLAGLVGRASVIIGRQHRERQDRVKQLTLLLEQNAQLHERVRRAAGRASAVNERYLHRLSAELHDGPCQDLGLALLRIDALADTCLACSRASKNGAVDRRDFQTIQTALQSALAELRTISTGLWLPALESLSPVDVAERAVRDYETKTGVNVTLSISDLPEEVALPVKITLYRVLQEALMNGFRHAHGADQRVQLWVDNEQLCAEVADVGAGFDPQRVSQNGHLGLVGMRERVELLGGAFRVQSAAGKGTTVQARLPLALLEDEDG